MGQTMKQTLTMALVPWIAAWAAIAFAGEPPAWKIVSATAQAGDRPGGEASAAGGKPFLHVQLEVPSGSSPKWGQFRVVDERGRRVAELYGYQKDKSLLVFEGDWKSLDGLYLEGQGQRLPLIPGARIATAPAGIPAPPPARPPVAVQPAPSPPPPLMVRPAPPPRVVEARPRPPLPPARIDLLPDERPSPPPQRQKPVDPAAEILYQEIELEHHAKFTVQGLEQKIDHQFAVLSKLAVARGEDGTAVVEQTVIDVRQGADGSLAAAVLGPMAEQIKGQRFSYRVGTSGEVTWIAEPKGGASGAGDISGGFGATGALIDTDGWREISEHTFFRPRDGGAESGSWDRPHAHAWGGLGSWNGKVTFVPRPVEEKLEPYQYTYQLTYRPPTDAGNLGVTEPAFKLDRAGGTIYFDPQRKRVARFEERFEVHGGLSLDTLGQKMPVEIDDRQRFQVRISDTNPWEKSQ